MTTTTPLAELPPLTGTEFGPAGGGAHPHDRHPPGCRGGPGGLQVRVAAVIEREGGGPAGWFRSAAGGRGAAGRGVGGVRAARDVVRGLPAGPVDLGVDLRAELGEAR